MMIEMNEQTLRSTDISGGQHPGDNACRLDKLGRRCR